MRNEFIGKLVLGDMKNMKLSWPQKELFPLPFFEFQRFFSFQNIAVKFYIKIFLVIIKILICRMLHLSFIILFNILKFSSNKKLEDEKLNKKSSLFKTFLELHLLLGFLWEKRVRKLSLQFKLLAPICRSLFFLHFCKN